MNGRVWLLGELKALQAEARASIPIRDRQHRLKVYPASFLAKDLVMWFKQQLVRHP